MHELGIAETIVETITERASACDAARVTGVRLRVGEASGVAVDSLTFCFEMLANQDPMLAGLKLEIDSVPHRARCPHCASEFAIEEFIARCPTCGEWSSEVLSGTDLQIVEVEIEPRREPV